MRRLQYDAPSQGLRNLVTNPELVADTSDKLLYKNVVTNPSFEAAGSTFDLWVNNIMNPAFRNTSGTTETRRNLAANPSFEGTSGTNTVRTNLITHPNFELSSGTSAVQTNYATNPGMEQGGSNVVVRTNLATNPGFEASSGVVNVRNNSVNNPSLATNATGWGTYGGGSTHANLITSRIAAPWSSGGYAWKVEGTASSIPSMAEIGIGDYTIGAGVPVSASVRVVASATRRARIRLRFNGAATDIWSPDFTLNASAPTLMTFTATAPAGTTSVSFSVKEGSGTPDPFLAGDWIAGSMAMLEINSLVSGPYFDGATPVTNLISNSDFETDTTGWAANTAAPTLSSSTDRAYVGTKSLKAVSTQVYADNAFAVGATLKAGQTYTFSYYVYSMDARTNCYFDVAATNFNAPVLGARNIPAQTWTRVSATFTTSSTLSGGTTFYLHNAGGPLASGTIVYVDAVLLEESPILNPYYAGQGDFTYVWATTAHASTSHQQAPAASGGTLNISGNSGTTSRVYQTLYGKNSKGLRITKRGGHVYFDLALTGLTSSTSYTISYDILSDQNKIVTVDRGTASASIYSPVTHTITPDVWTRVSRTIVTGSGDTTRTISLAGWENATVSDGASAIVDNLMIETGTIALPFFDGSTTTAENLTYAWTGTANASSSEQRGPMVIGRTGLLPNGQSWQSTTRSRSGTKSAAVLIKSALADNASVWYPGPDITVGTGAGQIPANTIITWSVYVYIPSGSGAKVGLMEVTSGVRGTPSATLYNQWQRISMTFTTPASGTVFLRMRTWGDNPAGSTFWIDEEMIEAANAPTRYFDGSNPIQNLCTNPSFATGTTDYTSISASLTRITTMGDGHVGELTQTIANAVRQGAIYISPTRLPEETYTVSFDVQGTAAEFSTVRCFLYDYGTATIVSQTPNISLIKDGNFNRYTFNLTATASFDRIYLEILGTNIPIGTKAWLDRVMIEKGTTASNPYYEGSGDFIYAWTGATDASSSTKTSPNISGWAQLGTLYRSTLDPKIGTYCAGLQTRGLNGDGLWPGTNLDVVGGRTYTFSAWIKATSAHALTAAFRWTDAANASTGADTNVTITSQLVVGKWALVSATATAPANTAKLQMMTRIYETHTPTTIYMDGAIVAESFSAVPYFDGSTAASGDFTYSWSGTANASTSLQKGVGVVDNSVLNLVPVSSTEWRGLGTKSVRLIPTLTHLNDSFTAVGGDTGALRLGMQAGKTYTISATIRLSAPLTGTLSARSRKIVVFHKSPADQFHIETPSAQAANVAGETRLSVTVTIPSTATEAFVRLYNGAYGGNGDVWWDNLLVEESATLRPYFDGARPAVENLVKSAALGQYVATHTTGVSYAGATWTRITTPAGTSQSLTRQYVDVNFLRTGEVYTTAVTVANDGATSVTIYFDWADVANTTHVIAPGEQKRIVTKGVRATGYNDTYRFADLHVQQVSAESKSILYKDWLIELGDTAGDYYTGTREFTYEWAGTANASASIEKAPTVVGNVASKSSGVGYENSKFIHYQSIDENGKKIARWFSPAGTPSSNWRVVNITNQSINYSSIVAGEPYTLIMKYRASGWGATQNLYVALKDGTSLNPVIGDDVPRLLNTNGWVEYRRTFTALINGLSTTNLYITLPVTPQATTDGIFDIAEWALVPGVYTGPYFDGTSSSTSNDFTVAWAGTADASVSKVVATSPAGISSGNYAGRRSWQSNGGPVAGKKSLAIVGGTPNVDSFAQLQTPPFAGETLGGRTFTVLATRKTTENYIASGADGRAWRPHWVVNKSGGGTQAYQPSTVESTVAGTYTFKWTFTFDADVTTSAFFRLYNGSVTVGNVVWWDDLAVIEGAYPGTYFDGDTIDTSDHTYLWDGAINASASSMRAYNIKGSWIGQRASIHSSADKPFSGTHKVKGVVSQIGYFPRLVSNVIPVTAGRRYTVSAKMKCGTQPVQAAIAWILDNGSVTSPIGQAASNGVWTRVSLSTIAPNNAVSAQLYLGVPNNSPLSTEFEVDNLMFVGRDYDGPFGSGDTFGWQWEGTPHASTSKGYPVGLVQLAGKPLFVGALAGQYVLTDIDPAKNPVLPAGAPRTIYTIVDNLGPLASGALDSVFVYGVDSLNDTTPNTTIIGRQQSQAGNLANSYLARRTGGGGPLTLNVPASGRQILISGINENGVLYSGVNKSALTLDGALVMSVPHERIRIEPDSIYHRHVITYIYPGVHSSALRAEMVRLLADAYSIPGLG